jgi:hypothetical protein
MIFKINYLYIANKKLIKILRSASKKGIRQELREQSKELKNYLRGKK